MEESQNNIKLRKLSNNGYYTPCSVIHTERHNSIGCIRQPLGSKWKEEWLEFTQNTTLHGLRYISMEHAFILRRLLWLLLVTVCLVGMSFQIIDRIIYYHDSPVNVNVKVNYNQSLIFPAITLCNQNAFKATLASNKNWYRLIELMFNGSSESFITDSLKLLNASDIRIDHLFTEAAHIKEDLIVECTWADIPCSHGNFSPVLTDHGLCFTFNAHLYDAALPLMAKATGADHGLKLLLNVEEYEYMPGPNDAAGIKILPHDQKEFPRVGELGISVPTGSHAFIGLKILKIENLPYPHGQCKSKDLKYFESYSYDSCQVECLTKEINRKCGCRNFYMPHIADNPPVCSLEAYYNCFLPSQENLYQDLRKDCDCPTPCAYNLYDPVLSYGTTSTYAADKLLDTVNASRLQEDLETARETSNRMEVKKLTKYTKIITDVKTALSNVKTLLVSKLKDKLTLQLQFLKAKYAEIYSVWKRKRFLYRYQLYNLQKNFIRGRDAMEERTLAHLCNSFHEFVYFIHTNLDHLHNNVSNTANRNTFYTILVDSINNRMENANRALANITLLYNAYQNGTPIFRYKYYRIPRRYNDYIVPKPLLQKALIHNYYASRYGPRVKTDVEKIIKSLSDYLELTDDVFYTGILNATILQDLSNAFIDGCEDYYHSKSVFYFETVEWPVKIIEKRYDRFQSAKDEYVNIRNTISSNVENLQISLDTMNSNFMENLDNVVNISQAYLTDTNITKQNVAIIVLSPETDKAIENCKQLFQEIRVRSQNVYDGWTQIVEKAVNIWIPILKEEDMYDYYNFTNNSEFLADFTNVTTELETDYIYNRNTNDLRYVVGNEDAVFLNSFDKLRTEVRAFLRSTEVDDKVLRNNFLQIDIFYRELNYEEITQQAAYNIFALLCDIGGSMGLFVGASVMTMFELLDLFANFTAERMVRRL